MTLDRYIHLLLLYHNQRRVTAGAFVYCVHTFPLEDGVYAAAQSAPRSNIIITFDVLVSFKGWKVVYITSMDIHVIKKADPDSISNAMVAIAKDP